MNGEREQQVMHDHPMQDHDEHDQMYPIGQGGSVSSWNNFGSRATADHPTPTPTSTPIPTTNKRGRSSNTAPAYPMQDIETYHQHDVLCGRGGKTNNHLGNAHWRSLVSENKRLYLTVPKRQKMLVAQNMVNAVRSLNPPGRFLQKDAKTSRWSDIGDCKAQDKASQALREGAPELRADISCSFLQKLNPADQYLQSLKDANSDYFDMRQHAIKTQAYLRALHNPQQFMSQQRLQPQPQQAVLRPHQVNASPLNEAFLNEFLLRTALFASAGQRYSGYQPGFPSLQLQPVDYHYYLAQQQQPILALANDIDIYNNAQTHAPMLYSPTDNGDHTITTTSTRTGKSISLAVAAVPCKNDSNHTTTTTTAADVKGLSLVATTNRQHSGRTNSLVADETSNNHKPASAVNETVASPPPPPPPPADNLRQLTVADFLNAATVAPGTSASNRKSLLDMSDDEEDEVKDGDYNARWETLRSALSKQNRPIIPPAVAFAANGNANASASAKGNSGSESFCDLSINTDSDTFPINLSLGPSLGLLNFSSGPFVGPINLSHGLSRGPSLSFLAGRPTVSITGGQTNNSMCGKASIDPTFLERGVSLALSDVSL